MHTVKRAAVVLAGLGPILCACSVTPSVKYDIIRASAPRPLSEDEFDAYYLQGSKIKITAAKPSGVDVTSVRVEAADAKLTLAHDDYFWVSTTVNITKVPNTDLALEVGTSVVDHRVEYITAAGGLVKSAISDFVAADPTVVDLPVQIDVLAALKRSDSPGAIAALPLGDEFKGKNLTVSIGPVPPDAIPFSSLAFPLSSSSFYYSACRVARVQGHVKAGSEDTTIDVTLKIADPNYVQRVTLPVKGKVTTHDQCGVSVATESNTGVLSDLAVAQALETQAKAVSDAVNAAEKPKKK